MPSLEFDVSILMSASLCALLSSETDVFLNSRVPAWSVTPLIPALIPFSKTMAPPVARVSVPTVPTEARSNPSVTVRFVPRLVAASPRMRFLLPSPMILSMAVCNCRVPAVGTKPGFLVSTTSKGVFPNWRIERVPAGATTPLSQDMALPRISTDCVPGALSLTCPRKPIEPDNNLSSVAPPTPRPRVRSAESAPEAAPTTIRAVLSFLPKLNPIHEDVPSAGLLLSARSSERVISSALASLLSPAPRMNPLPMFACSKLKPPVPVTELSPPPRLISSAFSVSLP